MSGDSSEEKSLAPSDRKLQEGRKKGQISKSQDIVSAMSMVFLTMYLILAWPTISGAFARMFDTAGATAAMGGNNAMELAIKDTWSAIGVILIPLYVLSICAIFLGSIISNKGIVFSLQPIMPDLKKISPTEGFKKIFSIRNFVEFLKALVKSFLLLAALGFAGYLGFEAMMRAPLCEEDCTEDVLLAVAGPLILGAIALFLSSALVDNVLQRWLFMRDMRMTHSEMKREMKEMYGDPMVRRARNEMKRDVASEGGSGKASKYITERVPTVLVTSGNTVAVAIRYIAGETPAPVVLAKGTGARATQLIQNAISGGVPVVTDSSVAEELLKKTKVEGFVPETMFRDVARVLNQAQGR